MPADATAEDIVEWISLYGEVKENITRRKVKKVEPLTNIGGVVDATTMEVTIKLDAEMRDKEYIDGCNVRIYYEKMPKTCYSCKRPGTECPTGGGAGYACKVHTKERH